MTAWGALLTCSPVRLVKIKKKKKRFKDSGNGPKDKHTKKHVFKNIYKNLVRKVRVYGIWTKMASSLPGPSSQADSCSQEHLPALRGFSSWELQNNSFSHLTRSHLLLKLSPECGQEVGALFFHPAPNHGVEACSQMGHVENTGACHFCPGYIRTDFTCPFKETCLYLAHSGEPWKCFNLCCQYGSH